MVADNDLADEIVRLTKRRSGEDGYFRRRGRRASGVDHVDGHRRMPPSAYIRQVMWTRPLAGGILDDRVDPRLPALSLFDLITAGDARQLGCAGLRGLRGRESGGLSSGTRDSGSGRRSRRLLKMRWDVPMPPSAREPHSLAPGEGLDILSRVRQAVFTRWRSTWMTTNE
jgi:hypothetical protein